MRNTISKAIVAGVAALSLGASLVATAEQASAQQWGGGWRGGGWGWRGAGWGGRGCWNCGWNNGWWGPAVVAGLAAGAVATYPWNYGYDSGYAYDNGNGCWSVRPTWDGRGRYLGRRWVNLCQ